MFRILPLLLFFIATLPAKSSNSCAAPDIKVYFSPHGGCTEAVIESLRSVKKSVLVEAYSFTSAPIAGALIDAKKRGATVEVILDKSQERSRGSEVELIARNHIPTYIDPAYRIAHDNFI